MIADFERYIVLVPSPAGWREHNNRAWAFYKLGQFERGLPDAMRALELKPDEPWALGTRGHILAALDRHDEAVADLRKALASNPDPFAAAEAREALERLGATP